MDSPLAALKLRSTSSATATNNPTSASSSPRVTGMTLSTYYGSVASDDSVPSDEPSARRYTALAAPGSPSRGSHHYSALSVARGGNIIFASNVDVKATSWGEEETSVAPPSQPPTRPATTSLFDLVDAAGKSHHQQQQQLQNNRTSSPAMGPGVRTPRSASASLLQLSSGADGGKRAGYAGGGRSVRKEFKILLIGDRGAGKTSLARREASATHSFDPVTSQHKCSRVERFLSAVERVGSGGATKRVVDLDMWVVRGHERFKTCPSSVYHRARCVLLCYDTTDAQTFESIDAWYKDASPRVGQGSTLCILVATKTDRSEERVVSVEEGRAKAAELGVHFRETSARTGHNVSALFAVVAAALDDARRATTSLSFHPSIARFGSSELALPAASETEGVASSLLKMTDQLERAAMGGMGRRRRLLSRASSYLSAEESPHHGEFPMESPATEDSGATTSSPELYEACGLACGALLRPGDEKLDHETKECWLRPVSCSNEQCDVRLPRLDVVAHERETCEYRTLRCEVCDELARVRDLSPDPEAPAGAAPRSAHASSFTTKRPESWTCGELVHFLLDLLWPQRRYLLDKPAILRDPDAFLETVHLVSAFFYGSKQRVGPADATSSVATEEKSGGSSALMSGVAFGGTKPASMDEQLLEQVSSRVLKSATPASIKRDCARRVVVGLSTRLAPQDARYTLWPYLPSPPALEGKSLPLSTGRVIGREEGLDADEASVASSGVDSTSSLPRRQPQRIDLVSLDDAEPHPHVPAGTEIPSTLGGGSVSEMWTELLRDAIQAGHTPTSEEMAPARKGLSVLSGASQEIPVDFGGRVVSVKRILFSELDLRSKVGSGSFGTVFVGLYRGGLVAAKRLHSQEIREEDLLREAAVLSAMSGHPHVMRFLGICIDRPDICLVSEALHCSLEQLLYVNQGNNTRGIDEIVRFASETASGLLHLHLEGVVHRDLAARNLLLDTSIPPRVKVADFGLARALPRRSRVFVTPPSETSSNSLESSGGAHNDSGGSLNLAGPVRWMAVESLRPIHGETRFSPASDVYSLSITIWELLTRDVPYGRSCGDVECALAAVQDDLRPPHFPLARDVEVALQKLLTSKGPRSRSAVASLVALLERGWTRDPKSRPSTQEFVQELAVISDALRTARTL